MQSGPFITFIATTLAVDPATVGVFVRELRKAGLLTTGARGVNAPHMLPRDAARLLIALMATDRPSEAVASVARWRAMHLRPVYTEGELPDYMTGEPTLEQALVRILAVDPDPKLWHHSWPAFEIARNEKSAMLEWGLKDPPRAIFREDGPSSLEDRREMRGIRRSCLVAPAVLMNLASGMWVDRFQGDDEKGRPLEINHPWNQEGSPEDRKKRLAEIQDYVRRRDADWLEGAD